MLRIDVLSGRRCALLCSGGRADDQEGRALRINERMALRNY